MELQANRGALTNIIAALLISSSLVVLAKVPPFVADLSLLGLVGYIIAAVLGLVLIISIIFQSR